MILAILQGRLSSTRLPGKVLKDLHGSPMIIRQIERLRNSNKIDKLVVATSVDSTDDELARVLHSEGVEVRRGSLDDVVQRFGKVVDEFNPGIIVRLTADCPLTDPNIIDQVIDSHIKTGADYSSNTLVPTYPDGLDIECISVGAFNKMRTLNLSESEKEHVTMAIYSNPDMFTLNSVSQIIDLSHLRWTVDVQEDLNFVRRIYQHLYDENKNFGQTEILELLQLHPGLSRTDEEVARNSGLNKK